MGGDGPWDAVTTAHVDGKGEALRATRDLPKGERLLRVAPLAAKTELETPSTTAGDPASVESGDAFDDPVATQFKAMYATPGKRIKWGVFKENVGPAAAAVSESADPTTTITASVSGNRLTKSSTNESTGNFSAVRAIFTIRAGNLQ